MKKNSEDKIVEKFCKHKANRKLYKEIPVYARSVDLVDYDYQSNEITAIEFKLNDWKTAINQLKEVSSCFDKLVLCMNKPKRKSSIDRIVKECGNYGIGLYFFNENNNRFQHSLNEKNNKKIWIEMKNSIIEYIENI